MIEMVRLNPTGNLTCLVTRKAPDADEAAITRTLMAECEQVAYLDPPSLPEARARIRLMGGEFCGNAAMAGACYLAERDGILPGEEQTVPLEISGAAGVLNCTVRGEKGGGYEGTVPMPGIESVTMVREDSVVLAAVKMPGILHMVLEDEPLLHRETAEKLLLKLAAQVPDDAVGLLQWDRRKGFMMPLVYVRKSGTLVWETGCGSGSAAVGAREAVSRGEGRSEIEVRQPGGMIRVTANVRMGWPEEIFISGYVRIGETEQRNTG